MALELENVHQHTQQHMNYIVDGLERRDRTLPGVARPDPARNLHEMEGAAAKHDERFDLRILERKTVGENLEGLPLTPTKPDVGSMTDLPRIGRNTARKNRMPRLRTELV
jgi:hypothetical protein